MKGSFRGIALGAVVVLLTALPVLAQGVQSSILQGTARDTAGLILPGVTVTVTSPALQGSRTTVTDGNGVYTVRGLPPAFCDRRNAADIKRFSRGIRCQDRNAPWHRRWETSNAVRALPSSRAASW